MKLNLKCKAPKVSFDLMGNMTLSLEVERESQRDVREGYDELKDHTLSCELKKYRPKRSRDANAYLWVLCSKIAEKLEITKEEVYKREIRAAGKCTVLPMTDEQVQEISDHLSSIGIGWFLDVLDTTFDGMKTVAVYYGSSTYNTKDMKRLIDSVIEEAKAQGIQTDTPSQIALMMARWEDCFKKKSNV